MIIIGILEDSQGGHKQTHGKMRYLLDLADNQTRSLQDIVSAIGSKDPNGSRKNQSCPNSTPNYKIINGSCFYFETSIKTHSDARENCKTKFGSGSTGRLFEPRSSIMNQEAFNEAMKLSTIGDKDNLWTGITNLRDHSVFEYESNGQDVVSGMWEQSQPNDRNIHHCVTVYEG